MMGDDTPALENLLRRRSDGRYELLVVIRRDIDYEEYEARIKSLVARNKSLEQQIYRFSMMANQYIDANDEIRRLKQVLRDHHISF